MKIAIPVKSENIYQHFGMASEFKIYHVENNQLIGTETVNATGRGHGVMLDLLVTHNVNCVICGGIGDGAIRALEQNGIQLFAGITGAADDAVSALLAGTLQSDMQAACSKHQHAQVLSKATCKRPAASISTLITVDALTVNAAIMMAVATATANINTKLLIL